MHYNFLFTQNANNQKTQVSVQILHIICMSKKIYIYK